MGSSPSSSEITTSKIAHCQTDFQLNLMESDLRRADRNGTVWGGQMEVLMLSDHGGEKLQLIPSVIYELWSVLPKEEFHLGF